jgi:hypothetical protein
MFIRSAVDDRHDARRGVESFESSSGRDVDVHAEDVGQTKIVAQSVAWTMRPGPEADAVASLEEAVLGANGVVLRVDEIAGALEPNSGIEQRFLRQVFQRVRKVRELMQKQVGRKRAHGAREGSAVEDVTHDRFGADWGQPARLRRRSRHRANGVTGTEEQW